MQPVRTRGEAIRFAALAVAATVAAMWTIGCGVRTGDTSGGDSAGAVAIPLGGVAADLGLGASGRETISGRVTMPDGTPAKAVRVVATAADATVPDGAPDAPNAAAAAAPAATAVTDVDGRYALPGLATRRYDVGIDAAAMHVFTQPRIVEPSSGQISGIDLAVNDGPLITVHVLDGASGKPIRDVLVGQSMGNGGHLRPTAVTDSDGIARFHAASTDPTLGILPRGGSLCRLAPAHGSQFTERHHIGDDGYTWTVRAVSDPSRPIDYPYFGTVIDKAGKPVAKAAVRVLSPGFEWLGRMTTTTDADGRFWIHRSGILQGETVTSPAALIASYGDQRGVAFALRDDAAVGTTIQVGARREAAISGAVVDSLGRPAVTQVRITQSYKITDSSGMTQWIGDDGLIGGAVAPTVTDAAGRFVIHGVLPEGTCSLEFGGQGMPQKSGRVFPTYGTANWSKSVHAAVVLRPGETLDIGRIVVPVADQSVSGVVEESTGRPVPRAVVSVFSQHMSMTGAPTGSDGRFQVDHLVNEPAVVYVSVNEMSPDGRSGDVVNNFPHATAIRPTDDHVTLKLPPMMGSIAGTVTDAAGRPVAGARVSANSDMMQATATTDAAGRFHLTRLTDEPFSLSVPSETDMVNGKTTLAIVGVSLPGKVKPGATGVNLRVTASTR